MDIVDSQVHMGPGGVAEMVAAMDAIGVSAALIHEYWMGTPSHPSYRVGGGAMRTASPTAELAAWTHPGRFAYLVHVDRRDPELAAVARLARDAGHAKALRVLVGTSRPETAAFAAGDYDELFGLAADCGLPIFVAISGNTDLLPRYLEKFREVRVIVDHCGMPPSKMIRQLIAQMEGLPDSEAYWAAFGGPSLSASLEKVLRLADQPNVAIKWAHPSAIFEDPVYPNLGVRPYLRRMLDAFGAERVMWGSDYTTLGTGETWAQTLFSIVHNPDLSESERERLLGGTARRWLNWEAAPAP